MNLLSAACSKFFFPLKSVHGLRKKMQMKFFEMETSQIIFFTRRKGFPTVAGRRFNSSNGPFLVPKSHRFEVSTIRNPASCGFEIFPPGGQRHHFNKSKPCFKLVPGLSARWPMLPFQGFCGSKHCNTQDSDPAFRIPGPKKTGDKFMADHWGIDRGQFNPG
jgi:hypothetical protein